MPVIDSGNEERHRREGLACPDAFDVAGTKPESGDSAEWVREMNIARHRVGFSAMQQSCDDCCNAENSTRLRAVFVSGRTKLHNYCSKLSRSAMFVTSVCIACACVSHANLICLAIRCQTARIWRLEFRWPKACCGESPRTSCFSRGFEREPLAMRAVVIKF